MVQSTQNFLHLNQSCNSSVSVRDFKADANVADVTNADSSLSKPDVRVPMVPVRISDKSDIHVLLDNASTSTFCTRRLVDELGIKGAIVSYSLSTLSESNVDKTTEVVDLDVKSADGSEVLLLKNVYIVNSIPVRIPRIDVSHYSHLRDLSFVN